MNARVAALTLVLVGALASALWGQEQSAVRRWLRPRVSLRSALWSSSRALDDRGPLAGAVLWGDLNPRLASWADLKLAGWAGAGELVGGSDGSLREFYGGFRVGAVDLIIGKQIIAWGRADALNPTDNLTPEDRTLLVEEEDDQKIGVTAARASAYLGKVAVTAIWLADFRGHTLPFTAPPDGVALVRRSPEGEAEQGAVRVEQSGGSVDWSVSYFTGFDLTPDLAFQQMGDSSARIILEHHRVHVIGIDAATAAGRYGVRAEAAWILTEDRDGRNSEIKNPTLYAIVGADRTFGEYLNINVQYLFRWVHNFSPPDQVTDPAARDAARLLAEVTQQLERTQHGFTFRISNKWWHETLEAEVAGVVVSPKWQAGVSPRISYAVTDRWRLVAGADLLGGGDGTLFHTLRKNSAAFLEVHLAL